MQNWYISVVITAQDNLVHKNNLAKILVCISEVAVRILDNFLKDFIYLFGLGGGLGCLLGGLSW